jgi:hypothetical protein
MLLCVDFAGSRRQLVVTPETAQGERGWTGGHPERIAALLQSSSRDSCVCVDAETAFGRGNSLGQARNLALDLGTVAGRA